MRCPRHDGPRVRENIKKELRERILALLRRQGEKERRTKSAAILRRLFQRPEFERASLVLFYASFDGEVDTFEMMRRAQKLGKRIALPYVVRKHTTMIPVIVESLDKDLETGPYGIRQPKEPTGDRRADLSEIDLVIVPGVAFDRHNNRLGRGLGYYDRFLQKMPSCTPSIGLAFDFQIVDHLPHRQGQDIPVSCVLVS